MPAIRPMTQDDVEAVHLLTCETFEDLHRRFGEQPDPRPDPAEAHIRYRHLVRTDPGGSWVAEDEHGIAGCALALLREGVWGLSLLVVRPGMQSSGTGSGLLRHAHDYAQGARGRIILSSPDPRAIRAYARLGLALHPAVRATGTPRDLQAPEGIRVGSEADIPFTEAVDRHVRGAAHGPDISTLLEMNQTLLVAPERGYAITSTGGVVRTLAAFDAAAAGDLLRAVLARATGEVGVSFITGAQQWAIDVCLEAKLDVRTDTGVVFLGGDVGPFTPYLPSGAFL